MTNPSGRTAERPTSRLTALLLLSNLLLCCLTGCGSSQKKQAQDLVQAGSTTSDQLAAYYDTLAQDRTDYLSLFLLELKRTGSPLDPGLSASIATQVDALEARTAMAQSLKQSYDKLGKLIDYDAAGEVQDAAAKLQKAIEDANHHPLRIQGIPIVGDVTQYFNDAIGKLADIRQMRDFRRQVPLVRDVLKDIKDVFDAEKPIYVQMAQDDDDETYRIARYLVDHDEATGNAAFQKFLDPYGLQPKDPSTPDPTVRSWTLDRLKSQMEHRKKVSQTTADRLSDGLSALLQAHDDFMHRKKLKAGGMKTTAQKNRTRLAVFATGLTGSLRSGKEAL